MSYRVFARKYRPETFEQVVGQEHITRTLQNAIGEDRVAQAYMFVGPRGIGKTSTARILAKALNCENGPTPHPCCQCSMCLEIAEGNSLDVLEIDGASNNGVEHVRELRENAAYAPARGNFKIYLIDEVHMLSTAAFNALLKTLEEPPPHVKFIFATTEAQKVLPTIVSRCQRFDLRRIPADLISKHLQQIASWEKITLEEEASRAIARAAEGGLRDAESMLDQAVAFCGDEITEEGVMQIFGLSSHESVSSFVNAIMDGDGSTALGLIASQEAGGKDLTRWLSDITLHLRDLLVQGASSDSPGRRDHFLRLLDLLAETEQRMRWSPDKKLQLEVAAIKAVHLLQQASIDELIDSLAALRSGNPPPPRTRQSGRGEPEKSAAPPAPAAPARESPRSHPARTSTEAGPAVTTEETMDDAIAWQHVAKSFEGSLRFWWLAHGVFTSGNAKSLVISFPASQAEDLGGIVGQQAKKEAASKLAELLGRKVTVEFQVDRKLENIPAEEPSQAEAGSGEAEVDAGSGDDGLTGESGPPASGGAEDFKNDPLIRKALEMFQAEIESRD